MADLAGIGVDIVTIGQYLRPTTHHLPVVRWDAPREFDGPEGRGGGLGIGHVEASPLTRSSYHAREAAAPGRHRWSPALAWSSVATRACRPCSPKP